jgi:site-specific DNA recombinase
MARFEAKDVGFVSITQHFDTSTSMGRLVLNILLSFAQFERELISERTRDKVQAARRRGKWTGGHVVLGYGLDPQGGGLVVVPEEAELVRRIFALYLQTFSVGAVAQRLNAEGITQKRRVTRSGRVQGGQEWDKKTVHATLRNPLYVGQVRVNGGELHPGKHEPIVSTDVFEKAGASLADRSSGQVRRRRTSEYVLAGLLRCGACNAGMTSAFSKGRNGKRYRYYRCVRQQNYGKPCPTGLVPAEKIEQLVVAQIRDVARRGDVQAAVLRRLEVETGETAQVASRRDELNEKVRALTAEAEKVFAAFRGTGAGSKLAAERLRAIEAEVSDLRRDIAGLDDRLTQARAARTRMEEVSRLLDGFDRVWEVLTPEERRELLGLLVAQVTMDAASGDVRIALHDLGPDGAAREEGRA